MASWSRVGVVGDIDIDTMGRVLEARVGGIIIGDNWGMEPYIGGLQI